MSKKQRSKHWDDYLARFERDVLPMIDSSVMTLAIAAKPDAKMCLEIGAAVLLDKPLIVLVADGRTASANLKRCASAIIEGDARDPAVQKKLQDALAAVVKNDRRAE